MRALGVKSFHTLQAEHRARYGFQLDPANQFIIVLSGNSEKEYHLLCALSDRGMHPCTLTHGRCANNDVL